MQNPNNSSVHSAIRVWFQWFKRLFELCHALWLLTLQITKQFYYIHILQSSASTVIVYHCLQHVQFIYNIKLTSTHIDKSNACVS